MRNSKRVITGDVRLSYVNIFEPRVIDGDRKKYSVSLIIPKSDKRTIMEIKKAIAESEEIGRKRFGVDKYKKLRTPLRDGDVEKLDDSVYKDSFFINAKSSIKPQVVDVNLNEIKDKSEVYSGCYGRASLSFYPYSYKDNDGIACSLGNIQKLAEGERLDLNTSAKDEFEVYDAESFFS